MAEAAVKLLDDDEIVLRQTRVRFPVELRPVNFRADAPETWPEVEGRLEVVGGRLLYMPPCADVQQDVAVDVVYILRSWSNGHPEFVVGANEAGMKLGNDIRAADAAVWAAATAGPSMGRVRHTPPILAVEVAGQDEDESALREKAHWYLSHGVLLVWLILPENREVLILDKTGERRCAHHEKLPEHSALPGLRPEVASVFVQLERA